MYLIQVAESNVDTYATQTARSFVIGSPSKAQVHLMDMMRFALKTMMDNIEVGRKGSDIWSAVNPTVEREKLYEWSQYGHQGGPGRARSISFSSPDNPGSGAPGGVVSEGHLLEVHPTLFDPATGDHGMTGDCIVIENGRVRNLAPKPLPYDLL
jgi:Xaa-Pro aminopeptidase